MHLQAVQVGQLGVPVLGVLVHLPDLARLVGIEDEGAGAWGNLDLLQIEVVLFQGLLAVDHVPARGDGRNEEASRGAEGELHRQRIDHPDLLHGVEHAFPGAEDARGWEDDVVKAGLHVVGGEESAIMELDAVSQMEGVRQPIAGHLPRVG